MTHVYKMEPNSKTKLTRMATESKLHVPMKT